MPHYHYHYHITYYYLYSLTIMLRKARAFSPHTMRHASKTKIVGHYHVTYRSRGVRTADQYACRPWSADFSLIRWLELFADQTVFENRLRIKTTVTVQLRTRPMRGLIVAVHLRTRTVRGFDPSDARGCRKIRGRPYCHSAYHWTAPQSLPVISY